MPVISAATCRRLNVAGRAHAALSRQRLAAARDAALAHRPESRAAAVWDGIRTNALRGACMARLAASPLTVGLDAVVSNRRGRPGHFCDIGIVPPALLLLGMSVALQACAQGVFAGMVLGAVHGARLAGFGEPVQAAACFVALAAGFVLALGATRYASESMEAVWRYWSVDDAPVLSPVQKVLGCILLGTLGVTLFTINQSLGLTTALVKAGITAVGLTGGALAGVAVGLYGAYAHIIPQTAGQAAHESVAQQKQASLNRETFLDASDVASVPGEQWFYISGDNGRGHGFDSRELAAWFSQPSSKWPWENPFTRVPLTATQARALAESEDLLTREAIAGRWPDAPWSTEQARPAEAVLEDGLPEGLWFAPRFPHGPLFAAFRHRVPRDDVAFALWRHVFV